jgi:hypothetical protein
MKTALEMLQKGLLKKLNTRLFTVQALSRNPLNVWLQLNL